MNPNDFKQLRLLFTDPIQHDYEAIRPVVLFAEPITQRSEETEMGRTTLSDKARRFVTEGMLGLADKRTTNSGRKQERIPGTSGTLYSANQATLSAHHQQRNCADTRQKVRLFDNPPYRQAIFREKSHSRFNWN